MASNDNANSPAKRAREELATLLAKSDENGNTCSYDVWPYANAWHQLQANLDPDSTVGQWQPELKRLGGLHKKANSKYKGTILRDPVRQNFAAQQCLKLKDKLDAGDSGAALDAVALCATHGLVIPSWLAVAFVSSYQAVIYGDARDWNDKNAFDSAFPKGANKSGVRAKKQMAPWAYECAKRLLAEDPSRAIDAGLYEDVGSQIGASQSSVDAWIKKHLERHDFLVPLAYYKKRLLAGRSGEEAEWDWSEKRFAEFHKSIGAIVTPIKPKRGTANHKKIAKN